jgi:Replication-relaxation
MLPPSTSPDRTPLTLLGGRGRRSLPHRRLSVDAAAVRLTPRDRAIAQDLTRFYGLTAEQVARRHFGALRTAANRLAALVAAGYVALARPWYRGPGVYRATPAGARLAAVGLPAPRYRPLALAHHLAVADLSELLLGAHPDGAWTCERELRRAAMTTVRDRAGGRLVDGVPHVPDGLLTLPAAGAVAVEVELTKKGDAEYARILRWYGATLAYRRVVWFVAPAALRRRLGELLARERLDDFMTVEPLPAGVRVPAWG